MTVGSGGSGPYGRDEPTRVIGSEPGGAARADEAPSPDGPPSAEDVATRRVPTQPGAGTPPGGGPPTAVATREHPPRPEPKGKDKGPFAFLRELPVLLLVAFLLALLIKTFLVQAFYIPSESMLPTLRVGDRVLVNKVVYHLHPPRRGDIIVFADPTPGAEVHRNPFSAFVHWLTEGIGVQTDPTKDFIKRVVGVPGDTVAVNGCRVVVNGHPLVEPYPHVRDCRDFPPHRVPGDSLFVMGDNRPNSNDSRYGLGYIPFDKVIGRAFVIIWPPSHVGGLHGF